MPGDEVWTLAALRHHFEALLREKDVRDQQRFDAQQLALRDALIAQEKAVTAALNAAEQAVRKAEGAAERRFESINEFRGQLADQAATLMPRAETALLIGNITERIAALEKRSNEGGGRLAGTSDARTIVFAAIAAITAIAAVVIALVR